MSESVQKTIHLVSRLLLLLTGLSMLVPFLWMLSTSLKADALILAFPPQIWPTDPTLASYTRLTELFPISRLFMNSSVLVRSYRA